MSTGSKSHLPPWIFLFLICFAQFLFGHLTSRYFFLCLAPWRWWFILKFWVAIVLAFPCITCLSDWGSKPSPVHKPLVPGSVYVHSPGGKTGRTSVLKFLGALPFPCLPAVSEMMALQLSAFLAGHAPGIDGNIPSWKQLACSSLLALSSPI